MLAFFSESIPDLETFHPEKISTPLSLRSQSDAKHITIQIASIHLWNKSIAHSRACTLLCCHRIPKRTPMVSTCYSLVVTAFPRAHQSECYSSADISSTVYSILGFTSTQGMISIILPRGVDLIHRLPKKKITCYSATMFNFTIAFPSCKHRQTELQISSRLPPIFHEIWQFT